MADVLALGVAPGPAVGRLLAAIEAWWIARDFAPDRAACRAGLATLLHAHRRSEEVYHVVAGTGRMTLGGAVFQIGRGDTVVIRPGIAHRVENSGRGELRILCACTPAYSRGHDRPAGRLEAACLC